jgi:hypothetical protein
MFCLPGTILVLITIYLRPQEIVPRLQALPLLHIFLALAIGGFIIDLRLRLTKPMAAPQLPWAIAFSVWQVITLVAKVPGAGGIGGIVEIFIPFILFVVIGHGVQTFKAFNVIVATLLGLVLFLSYVGVNQHNAPQGCHALLKGSMREGVYDGRPCDKPIDCQLNGPEPGAEYVCEHVGLFGTTSVGGRIRWLGVLADPNELALAVGIALPFAFAFFERKKSLTRGLIAAVSIAYIGQTVVYSESRGGQMVVAAVFATYFVRRYGWRGLILAGIAAAPFLLFGGRSGEEAAASSEERYECWWTGLQLLRMFPLMGVGRGAFTDYHYLTAHNAYVLSFAENGLPGFFLFSTLLYVSAKIPFVAVRRANAPVGDAPPLAPVARAWALAMLASMLGAYVGIFFLSFTYHYVLWTYLGLSAALYACIRTHDSTFEVSLSLRELIGVAIADVALIAGLWAYLHGKV